jgi:membrane protease YdiL (CAAX protease family)
VTGPTQDGQTFSVKSDKQSHPSHWRISHGFVFLTVLACTTSVPTLARWPWPWLAPWLAPLLGYFAIMLCVPLLRRSFSWLRVGHLSWINITVTLLLTGVTIFALLLIPQARFPAGLADTLPFQETCGNFLSCALFAIINAVIQEMVFRGVLFDSLECLSGRWRAILITAFVFGLSHLPVMPSGLPGMLGASGAADLSIALGFLRSWSGGLALPILLHIAVDATIIYRAV